MKVGKNPTLGRKKSHLNRTKVGNGFRSWAAAKVGRKQILPKVGKNPTCSDLGRIFPTLGRMGIGFLQGRKSPR